MLKVWGRANSINVQKVMWCVDELGIEHERIDAGRQFGKTREDWFLAMNPNATVPVIDDDGFVLWESNAIVRYLAAKSGGLGSSDEKARALAEQWMDWSLASFHAPLTTLFWDLIRSSEVEPDAARTAAAQTQAEAVLAILEAQLAERLYVLGDALSMADIPIGTMVYRWYALPIEPAETPNLRRYYERLCLRPAYRANVMIPLS